MTVGVTRRSKAAGRSATIVLVETATGVDLSRNNCGITWVGDALTCLTISAGM